MRRAVSITCVLAICFPLGAGAMTGLSLGAKIGLADYTGDVLPGSGGVGSGTMWSVVLGIGSFPILDLELRASYFAKDFEYSYDVAGVPVDASFRFQNVGATLLLKKNLFAPPASPVSLYAGIGVGMHYLNTELGQILLQGGQPPSQADAPLSSLGKVAKPSGAGLVGLRLAPPGFPLAIFGEASYDMIFASERLEVTQFAGGLMLRF